MKTAWISATAINSDRIELTNSHWTFSRSQLQAELLAEARYSYTVAKILPHSSSCGTYLARLASKLPERFKSTRSGGKTKWTILKEKEEKNGSV